MHIRELFDLTGKVALVTGGSRGLGLEMAEGLAEAGAAVIITARRLPGLEEAERRLKEQGFDCLAVATDVSDPAQAGEAVRETVARHGKIDILVNNAGIAWGALAEAMPLDKWQKVIDVNLTGAFSMAQAAARHMIPAGGGNIINIASIAGLLGCPTETLSAVGYSASKAGLIGLTRDLAVKWARHGIRVNAIAPGFFPTRMTEAVLERSGGDIEGASPMGRTGRPNELKGVAVFLASPASSYITGQVLSVDGGTSSW